MNGGYQMIDCGGLNLLGGSTPQVKTGLYDKVKKALEDGKPIIAHNCIYGSGHPMSPICVFAQQESDDTIVCTASILQIWITDEDSVTVQSLVG